MTASNFHPFAPVVTAPVVNQVSAPAPVPREIPFRFTGDAKEYFRIWIVNIALSILTLGIYSAWAKVRTKQYFYRSTFVEDASFDYLADPVRILKGRIIMAMAFGLLFWSQFYSLPVYIALLIVAVLLTPVVLVKSLAFNARNTAYRNVRFSFLGNAGEAFGVYLQIGVMYFVTCGLAYPYAQWRMTQFVLQRHLFGDERFTWSTKSGEYFRIFLIALAMSIPIYALVLAMMLGAQFATSGEMSEAMFLPMLLLYALLLLPFGYVRAKIANAIYNGLCVGPHRFASNQHPLELIKLYVTNALGVIVSLGLLTPWAQIRLARYRAEHLKLIAVGPIEAGNYEMAGNPSALGDAATDLGDFDLELGL